MFFKYLHRCHSSEVELIAQAVVIAGTTTTKIKSFHSEALTRIQPCQGTYIFATLNLILQTFHAACQKMAVKSHPHALPLTLHTNVLGYLNFCHKNVSVSNICHQFLQYFILYQLCLILH